MKFPMPFLCMAFAILNSNPVFSAPPGHLEVNPEKAKEIYTFPILGASLSMSMGEIKAVLEGQGFTLKCSYSDCTVREGSIQFAFSYRQARYDRTPLDESHSPEIISYGVSGADPEKCTDLTKAVAQFCADGSDKFPCRKNNNTIMMDILPRMMSNDGWKYTMNLKNDPPIHCKIKVGRQKMRK